MKISLLCAMCETRGIGYKNTHPWQLSNDLKRFKAMTLGKPIIMGRKTWESLGRPLPGRRNIIITRNPDYVAEGGEVFTSFEDIKASCSNEAEICIIGGAEIYKLLLPEVDTMYLTLIESNVVSDAYFPEFSQDDWDQTESEAHKADPKNDYDYRFVTLKRKA